MRAAAAQDAPAASLSLRRMLERSPGDQRDLEAAIRRLGRQLHGAETRRMRRAHTGRVDVAQTLRATLGYEGVPLEPVMPAPATGRAAGRLDVDPQPCLLLAATRVRAPEPLLARAHLRLCGRSGRDHPIEPVFDAVQVVGTAADLGTFAEHLLASAAIRR